MKTINKFLYAIAALSMFAAVGCEDESEYTPGESDLDGCYGVYFPSQENTSGSLVMNPSDPTYLDITVARTNSNGAITVPVTTSFSDSDVLSVTELSFADGQSETTMTLNFPNAKEGTTYEASLTIDDPQYASLYKDNASSCDISFMRVAYQDYLNPVTGEPALVTFTQGWWGEVHTAYVKFYEVDGLRYCETYDEAGDISGAATPGPGFWGNAEDVHLSFIWHTADQNSDGYDYIEVPAQYMGWDYSEGSPVYVYDWYAYWYSVGQVSGTFLDFAGKYGASYPLPYYDGNGGFYLNLKYYVPGVGGWTPDAYDCIGVADGFTRVDYSMSLSAGQSSEGVLPVKFSVGADVAKVKYSVLAGSLTAIQVTNAVTAITGGTDANTKEITVDTTAFTEGISLDSTGVYTLVAVPYDNAGAAQGDFAASVGFKYLKAGDEEANAVILSVNLNATNKYASQGYTSDTSLEYWLSGADLESVKLGVFSQAEMESDEEACLAEVEESDAISDADLEFVNGSGLTSVATGLTPGTTFYLVVVASNGYATDTFTASATTTGDPLPIYATYTIDDYAAEYAMEDETGFYGTWNLYATEFGGSSLRSMIGTSAISDSENANSEVDSNGYSDQYVYATGFAGPVAVEAGVDDTIELDYYAGALYISLTRGSSSYTTVDGSTSIYHLTSGGSGYGASYIFYAIPVLDGYYAFIPDSSYDSYGFYGLWFYQISAAYGDYLLVNPEKDDNATATSSAIDSKVSAAKAAMRRVNGVETIEGNRLSRIEAATISARNARIYNHFNCASVKVQDGAVRSVSFSSKRMATTRNDKSMAMEAPLSL